MSNFLAAERDNCGVGVIVNKYGIPQHDILIKGIYKILEAFS